MADEATDIRLADGPIVVRVDPLHGGRVRSMTVRGVELLVNEGEDLLSWGIYPMVPYAGRVRDAVVAFEGRSYALRANASPHSLHGTVFDAPWNVQHRDARSVSLSVSLGPDWPFEGVVSHEIRTDGASMTCALTVTCTSDSMPAQVGWHPWFRKPDRVRLDFAAMLQRDASGIATSARVPVADGPLDDCLVDPSAGPSITVDGVAVQITSNCDHWVVYDGSPSGTCIEPQSGPPNGINDDPTVLRRGESLSRWMTVAAV